MNKIILCGSVVLMLATSASAVELEGHSGQSSNRQGPASIVELKRAVADSTDDAQESTTEGNVYASASYMELMLNWFQQRWGGGVRFSNLNIPQGAEINSAYVSVVSFSTCWLRTYDSVACEAVDSASSFGTAYGSYGISSRWANRTNAVLVWNEDMRYSSVAPDSTPDLKDLLQEVVDRQGWKSGNSVAFLFKNIRDHTDSAMYEFRTWEDVGWEETLFVSYSTGSVVPNDTPVVSDIPDSTVAEGQTFSPIILDEQVEDPDNLDGDMIWTHWGEVELLVDITDRVASVAVSDSEWNGSESIWFKACDPGGLCDSNQATFTVTPVNDPPIVFDISDSTILKGELFDPIYLDNYVEDPDNQSEDITWTAWGDVELRVDIIDRVATVTVIDSSWEGSENIWFEACDAGVLCDSNDATFTVLGSASVDEDTLLSAQNDLVLDQNHPNPFNLGTRITYSLPTASRVVLVIYDVLGRRIRTVADERQSPGHKSLEWNGKDDDGSAVASGIYFYRLETESFTETKKMLLLK